MKSIHAYSLFIPCTSLAFASAPIDCNNSAADAPTCPEQTLSAEAPMPEAVFPQMSELDSSVQTFITTLVATYLTLNAQLSDENLLQDPIINAVTIGHILNNMNAYGQMNNLPEDYQAYFEELLIIEQVLIEEISSLNNETHSSIKQITDKAEHAKARLTETYPLPATLFNDIDALTTAIIEQKQLRPAITNYIAESPDMPRLTSQEATGKILRFIATCLIKELHQGPAE